MYESFYHLTEKPFTLLPDPGFLYLSEKHRMALTLLEYGLSSQAGFTVISGEIGAGKTTLIRYLLNNMNQDYTVGLITNTHRSFGELLDWILHAFGIEHKGMNKVEMYQRFIDFIIDEYARNRRTVLIIDEAQNMDAETLEELRMLSNVNADKNQALQVVLSGQRELRETLRSPALVQFAQRIAVDYHLEPLAGADVEGYVRHRMEVAGGDPATFTAQACAAIHRYSTGIPRLINLLCDTALVYGYAENRHRIDARLITEVAREKQQGGLFPVTVPAELSPEDEADRIATDSAEAQRLAAQAAAVADNPLAAEAAVTTGQDSAPVAQPQTVTPAPGAASGRPEPVSLDEAEQRWEEGQSKKKLRLVVCAEKAGSRQYLSRLLESFGFDVIATLDLQSRALAATGTRDFDVLLIDRHEAERARAIGLAATLRGWQGPVLYNDARATADSLQYGDPLFGQQLARRIHAVTGRPARAPDTTGC